MKIAMVQMNIQLQNKKKNFSRMKEYIKNREPVDLILFPEMSLTGFSMDEEACLNEADEYHKQIKLLAKEEKVMIGYGWVQNQNLEKLAENHYVIIDENGVEIMDYTKIHPFSFAKENNHYQAGNQIALKKIKGFMCSIFICYDLRFPEIFQAVSKKAEFIIIAANWPHERIEQWHALLIARAIENQVYIAGINCVGTQNGNQYSGNTLLVHPSGKIIKEGQSHEEILYCELVNDVAKIRQSFPVKQDRKEKFYIRLMNHNLE